MSGYLSVYLSEGVNSIRDYFKTKAIFFSPLFLGFHLYSSAGCLIYCKYEKKIKNP